MKFTVQTNNGAWSQNVHGIKNALRECNEVYIKTGLIPWLINNEEEEVIKLTDRGTMSKPDFFPIKDEISVKLGLSFVCNDADAQDSSTQRIIRAATPLAAAKKYAENGYWPGYHTVMIDVDGQEFEVELDY